MEREGDPPVEPGKKRKYGATWKKDRDRKRPKMTSESHRQLTAPAQSKTKRVRKSKKRPKKAKIRFPSQDAEVVFGKEKKSWVPKNSGGRQKKRHEDCLPERVRIPEMEGPGTSAAKHEETLAESVETGEPIDRVLVAGNEPEPLLAETSRKRRKRANIAALEHAKRAALGPQTTEGSEKTPTDFPPWVPFATDTEQGVHIQLKYPFPDQRSEVDGSSKAKKRPKTKCKFCPEAYH